MDYLLSNGPEAFEWPTTTPSGLPYAVQLLKSVLSTYWARDQHQQYWNFLIPFLKNLDKSCERLFANFFSDANVYNDVSANCDVWKENFFWAIKLCRGRGPLPIPAIGWPTELVFDMGHFILNRHTAGDVSSICSYYESMLAGTVAQSKLLGGGGKAVKPSDLPAILRLLSVLTETHRRHIPGLKSRTVEFMAMGKNIIQDSESSFGVSSDPTVIMHKATLSLVIATALIDDRDSERYREELKKGMDLLRPLLGSSKSAVASNGAENLTRKSPKEAAMIKAAMDELASRNTEAGGTLEQFFDMAMAEAMGHDIKGLRKSHSGISSQGHPTIQLWDSLLRNHKMLVGPAHKRRLHENEIDRGHWARAMGHHSGLLVQSLTKLDFAEAQGHIDAQEAIARKHGVYDEQEQRLQDARKAVSHTETVLSVANFDSVTEKFVQDVKTFWADFKPDGLGGDISCLIQRLATINSENWARDHDESLAHNQAPGILASNTSSKDGMMAMLAKYANRCANSSEYTKSVLAGMVKVVETLQRLERAEDESNVEAIYRVLDEFRELSQEEFCREFVNDERIDRRADWNTARLLTDISTTIAALNGGQNENMDECSDMVQNCRQIISLSRCAEKEKFSDAATMIETLCQGLHLSRLARDALSALQSNDESTFLQRAKDILKLREQGAFEDALLKQEYRAELNEVWMEYFKISLLLASESRRWVQATEIFTAWRAEKEVWDMTSRHGAFKAILRQEWVCLAIVQMLKFVEALERFDLPLVAAALDGMRRQTVQCEVDFPGEANPMRNDVKSCSNIVTLVMRQLVTSGPMAAHAFAREAALMVREQGIIC